MHSAASKTKSAASKQAASVGLRPQLPVWSLAGLLALATLALYWPALGHGFINFDDPDYVTANAQVQSGLSGQSVQWAFLNPVGGNWHPLTVMSHMLDCRLFGMQPWGHHWTNLLLHALNAALVFVLLERMTGAWWKSAFVAALFAFHPLRVESVAWVAERKDVLSGFFGLLSLLCYARYAQAQRRNGAKNHTPSPASALPLPARYYLLSLCFLALGLLSKPMLVTWPLVLLLLDYWPLRRFEPSTLNSQLSTVWRLLAEKVPFLALAAAASVVTFMVQQREGALAAADNLSLAVRAGNALVSCCRYLGKLLYPTGLSIYYPHPGQWPLVAVLLSAAFLAGISSLFLLRQRQSPFLLMGWLWFLGTLVPVLGLVQMGSQALADRYTYLPSLGLLILATWGAWEATTRSWRHQRLTLWIAGTTVIGLCMVLTRQQLRYWKNSEALFRHALEVTPGNPIAHNALGSALAEKGDIEAAASHFQAALQLRPDFADAHVNLATALADRRNVAQAISEYEQALRLEPHHALANYRLASLLTSQGQTDKAIAHYLEAIRADANLVEAHVDLGTALSQTGRAEEAIGQYRQALRLRPSHAAAHYNLANLLAAQGHLEEALSEYQQALRVRPDHVDAHNNLGVAFYQLGRLPEAIGQFREVLRLKPDYAGARKNLEAALAASATAPTPSPAPPNAAP